MRSRAIRPSSRRTGTGSAGPAGRVPRDLGGGARARARARVRLRVCENASLSLSQRGARAFSPGVRPRRGFLLSWWEIRKEKRRKSARYSACETELDGVREPHGVFAVGRAVRERLHPPDALVEREVARRLRIFSDVARVSALRAREQRERERERRLLSCVCVCVRAHVDTHTHAHTRARTRRGVLWSAFSTDCMEMSRIGRLE